MKLIENFISNKIYSALYIDILVKYIWERIIELWHIGGSARPGAIVLFLLIILILLIPLIPFIAIIYFGHKFLKNHNLL